MRAKKIAVLGSTGSVGTQALQVVEQHPDRLRVVGLAAGRNVELIGQQARRWNPAVVSVQDEVAAKALGELLGDEVPRIVWGDDGLLEVTSSSGAELVLNAVVGAAGLAATHAAVSDGTDVALANKESLVMAGELIMKIAGGSDAAVLPVDSEPNALHQCLRGVGTDSVRRLVLTASGGPFRGWETERLASVSPDDALNHPTWKMGPRITIDSATLMNKGFEIIESHWLFGIPVEAIDVVIHPQSIVHSLVEFVDGSMIAQAGPTDMRLPIQDALAFPERWEPAAPPLELAGSSPWTFEEASLDAYPALRLARQALESGGTAPAALNAADEVAVAAFLEGALRFDQILPLVEDVMTAVEPGSAETLGAVLEADGRARKIADDRLREVVGS